MASVADTDCSTPKDIEGMWICGTLTKSIQFEDSLRPYKSIVRSNL